MKNKKETTLGIPHGTAAYRLRKNILFKYVRQAGDHFCYRCGAEIENIRDFSIEHKLPWEGVSPELFYDLDNIAFAHLSCNSRSKRYNPYIKTKNQDNTITCKKCGEDKDITDYHKESKTKLGIRSECKECRKR